MLLSHMANQMDTFFAALSDAAEHEIRGTWLVVMSGDRELATFEAWFE